MSFQNIEIQGGICKGGGICKELLWYCIFFPLNKFSISGTIFGQSQSYSLASSEAAASTQSSQEEDFMSTLIETYGQSTQSTQSSNEEV